MSLFINPNLLQKVQEASNPLLNVPEEAKAGRGNTFRWTELVTITSVRQGPTDKGRQEVEVRFRVSLASENASNRGKSTRMRCLLNLQAAEGTGDFQMTIISLSNLRSLIRAAMPGFDVDTEGFDLETMFDVDSPLLNQDVLVQITDKPDRDDPTIRRQELSRFTGVGE